MFYDRHCYEEEESNVDAMKSEWINIKGVIWFILFNEKSKTYK